MLTDIKGAGVRTLCALKGRTVYRDTRLSLDGPGDPSARKRVRGRNEKKEEEMIRSARNLKKNPPVDLDAYPRGCPPERMKN